MSDDTDRMTELFKSLSSDQQLDFLKLYRDMYKEIERLKQRASLQDAHIAELDLFVRRLLRVKTPNAEALDTFEQLKRQRPDLTLADFARTHDLNYDALRTYRARRRRKKT
jgi:hypothetical protein